MHVVATAGHVDHGKSTLVQALTGMQPDRLAEEQRRALTIELGYAWTELEDVGEVAFVDVPGHERFLATALAGVGPVQAAMLVVAADDPWMPQAAEHLRVLSLLGARIGVVAVSRSDLADPAPAIKETRAHLAGTPLADAPIVPVSAKTGLGLIDLRQKLASVLAASPVADPESDVRLWVDRRFHLHGIGTVVTGTLPAGTIRRGDVLVDALARTVRVRGLEALGRRRDVITGPARVALNISGAAEASLRRGSALLTPGAFLSTTLMDVELEGSDRLPHRIHLHIGAARQEVGVRPLAGSYARLTLSEAAPVRVGDRVILRDPGSRELWGARVLDPAPPPLTRRGAARLRAESLANLDGTLATYLDMHGALRRSRARQLGLTGPIPAGSLMTEEWLAAGRPHLAAELVELATRSPGLSLAEATRLLGLPDPALVESLISDPLEYVGGRIHRADRTPSARAVAAVGWLRSRLADRPYAAPTADELQAEGIDADLVAELQAEGWALRLAPGVVLLPEAADSATTLLAELPQPFTTSAARVALDTSRRVALPLLALLDATGRTVRMPDDRRRVLHRE